MDKTAALLAIAAILAVGCGEPHKARIVCLEYSEDANDGTVARNCRTTLEVLDTGHRMIWPGRYGNTGDVFTVYQIVDGWSDKP
jgi:hypothetical protein